MYTRFDFMLRCDAGHKGAVAHATLIERDALRHGRTVPSPQIIKHYNLFTFCSQSINSHAADVPSATGYQNCHFFLQLKSTLKLCLKLRAPTTIGIWMRSSHGTAKV